MKTAEPKIASSTVQRKAAGPFFNKGGASVLSSANEIETPFFTSYQAAPTVQAKLDIGQPNDKYEQEADAVADKVVQKVTAPVLTQPKETANDSSFTHSVQSKVNEKDNLQKKEEETKEEEVIPELQRQPMPEALPESPPAIGENNHNNIIGGIQLKCAACEEEEKETVQKKEAPEEETTKLPVQAKLTIGEPDDPFEKEADAVADQVVQKLSEPDVVQTKPVAIEAPVTHFVQAKSNIPSLETEPEKEEENIEEGASELQRKSIIEALPDPPEAPDDNNANQPNTSLRLKCDSPATLGIIPAIQSKPIFESDAEPVVQRRCRECDEGDQVFLKPANLLQLSVTDTPNADGSRESILAAARTMLGKIEAKNNDGTGKRVGAEYLLEIFHLAAPGVWDDSIIETAGAPLPSWCGIFSVWAHKKAGKNIGTWQMGKGVSAFGTLQPTTNPMPGDIGYIHKDYQHHALVVKVEGDMVHTIDGNSGAFSEVKENIKPKSKYNLFLTAFSSSGTVQRKVENNIQKEGESTAVNTASSSIESKLSSSKGSGVSLPEPIRNNMESSVGADFSNVKIHTDSSAVELSKELNAQAFTHGSDIYFNSGKYDTESKGGQHLLAHELTHTVQQGAAVQKKERPVAELTRRQNTGPESLPVQTARFITEDNVTPAEGQLTKTAFITRLNSETCSVTDEALAGTPFSSASCPYITRVFARLSNQTPVQIEATAFRYDPRLRSALNLPHFFQLYKERVRTAVTQWLHNGDLSGVPAEIAAQIPESLQKAAGVFGAIKSGMNALSSGVGAITSGISNIISGLGGLFFKSKEGGASATQSPQAVMNALGKGEPIETTTRSKMESAFGTSFTGVEIHTGNQAEHLSNEMNAHAFTVGNHIAFGSDEYQPGSVYSDALLAHELVHVEQQRNAETGVHHKNKSTAAEPGTAELEQEAEKISTEVVSSLYFPEQKANGKTETKQSGLKIQRCGPSASEYKQTGKQKIEDFEEDEAGKEKFKDTKDSIFKLDVSLAKEFAAVTGPSFWFTTVSLGELEIQVRKLSKFNSILDRMLKKGVGLQQIFGLLQSVRQKALYKALVLLEKNENILNAEKAKYEDDAEVKKIGDYLRGTKEQYNKADEGRIDTVMKLLEDFEIDRPHNLFGEMESEEYKLVNPGIKKPSNLAIELIKSRKNKDAVRDILQKTANPVAVRQGLIQLLLHAYNPEYYIRKTGEYHEGKAAKVEAYVDKHYPALSLSELEDIKAETNIRSKFEEFPILADTTLNIRMLAKQDDKFIKYKLKSHINAKIEDIQTTRENLIDDPDKVYELKPLIMLVMSEEGISKKDPLGIIILDKVSDLEDKNTIRSIGLGALGAALAIAGFFTGGATWWVSAGLIGSGVAVSAIDLYYEYKSYSLHSAASNVGFTEAEQLSTSPSAFGLFLAIFGLVIDVADVVKLFKAAPKLSKAVNGLSALGDTEKIQKSAGEIFDDLQAKGLVKQGVSKPDFVNKVTQTAQKEAALVKPLPEEFVKLLGDIKYNELPVFMQSSLRKLYDTNAATFETIIRAFKSEPEILARFGTHIVADPNLTGAFLHINRLLPNDKAVSVFRYIGGIGAEEIQNLPNALSVIIRGNIKDQDLLVEILTNRRLQQGIWSNAADPELFNKLWKGYQAKKAAGANYSFLDYVHLNGISTKGVKTELSLVDEMGVGFELLKTNFEKNLALLGKTEMNLAAEIAKPLSESSLSPKIYNRLKEILDRDVIGKLTEYKSAKGKLTQIINEELGSAIETLDDYKKLLKLTQQGGSKGSIGELAAKKFNIPPGAGNGKKISVDITNFKHPKWPSGNSLRIIVDNFLAQVRKIGEIKVGTSFDIDQFKSYDFLIEFQNDAVVKNAVEKAFKDAGVPAGKIKGVSYGLLPGPDDIAEMEKAVAAGTKITDPVEARAFQRWDTMVKNSHDISNVELHYLTVEGKHYKIVEGGKKVLVKTIM